MSADGWDELVRLSDEARRAEVLMEYEARHLADRVVDGADPVLIGYYSASYRERRDEYTRLVTEASALRNRLLNASATS